MITEILAGAGLGLQAAQAGWNAWQTHKTNKQNQANYEREIAYNHPVQQAKRLSQAGINPLSAYGGGMMSAGNAVGEKPKLRPSHSNLQFDPMMPINAMARRQEIDNLKKTGDLADSQRTLNEAKTFATLFGTKKVPLEMSKLLADIKSLNAGTAGTEAKTATTLHDLGTVQDTNLKTNDNGLVSFLYRILNPNASAPKQSQKDFDKKHPITTKFKTSVVPKIKAGYNKFSRYAGAVAKKVRGYRWH